MVFLLFSLNMVNYIDLFSNVILTLHFCMFIYKNEASKFKSYLKLITCVSLSTAGLCL